MQCITIKINKKLLNRIQKKQKKINEMVDIHNVKNIHTNFHIIELKIRKPSNIALFTSTNGGVGQKTLSMHYINTIHTHVK